MSSFPLDSADLRYPNIKDKKGKKKKEKKVKDGTIKFLK